MKTICKIKCRTVALSAIAVLSFFFFAASLMAGEPIAIYNNSTKTLQFAVVTNAEAIRLKTNSPETVWYGEDELHTTQMKEAPWKAYRSDIETVTFASTFSSFYPQTVYAWFAGCRKLSSVKGLQNLNLSETYEMRSMFYNCSALKEIDLSMLNTKNVKYMSDMFYGCFTLATVNFGSIDTSNVLSMSSMFRGANLLESIDMSRLNLSNVTNLSRLFQECNNLKNVKFPRFTTSNLTDMSYLFYRCNNLQTIDLSGFNTQNVTNMSYMFEYCSSLEEVDVSNFDVSSLTDAHEMFSYCYKLKKIYSDKDWRVSSVMFTECSRLSGAIVFTRGKESGYLYSNPTTGYFTPTSFNNQRACAVWCEDNATLYFTSVRTPLHIGNSFKGATITDYWWGDELTDCSTLGKPVWLNAYNSSIFKSVVFTPDFLNADNMVVTTRGWFEKFVQLTSVTGCEFFNTKQVRDMGRMFSQCESLETLNGIKYFNTSRVTDMDSLFYQCRELKSIDLSGLNTYKVKNFADMFARCYSLTSLDVSGFYTGAAENFTEMFYYCTALQTIYSYQGWNKDIPSKNMFYRCEKLKGSMSYDSFYTDATYANPDNGYFTYLQNYDLWICGTQVSTKNYDDLTRIEGVYFLEDDGYFYYDPESNTLKIKNITVGCADDFAVYSWIKDLTLEIAKDSKAAFQSVNGQAAMLVEKPTKITGGQLQLIGSTIEKETTVGLLTKSIVSVVDGDLLARGTYGIKGYDDFYYNGGLSVSGKSYVRAYGTEACIATIGSFSLGDNVFIAFPEGASFERNYIRLDGEILKNTTTFIAYVEPQKTGDVNEDGNVDINDVVAVINVMAGNATWPNANVNDDPDGRVDINDVVAVINIMAGH